MMKVNMVPLFSAYVLLLLAGQTITVSALPSEEVKTSSETVFSCLDVYKQDPTAPTGAYVIGNKDGGTYSVFCDFYDGYGYTFVAKTTQAVVNIEDLYTSNSHVILRQLAPDGGQKEIVIEQLSIYPNVPLAFFYNASEGFNPPLNVAMAPYLYLGFLSKSIAAGHTKQGYRAGGTDYGFTNCDTNPNSYLTLYFNPDDLDPKGYYLTCCNTPLMNHWVTDAKPVPVQKNMPRQFYFDDFEMHMGGCGGYTVGQSYTQVDAVALGLRFDVTCEKPDPLPDNADCVGGGKAYDSKISCTCRHGYTLVSGDLDRQCLGTGKYGGQPPVCAIICPPGFTPYGKTCYAKLSVSASWGESLALCEMAGAGLATISDESEQLFLMELIGESKGHVDSQDHQQSKNSVMIDGISWEGTWIGGTDMLIEGMWMWSQTLEPLNYTNWSPQAPAGSGHCLLMNTHTFQWKDTDCGYRYYPLCQTIFQEF